MTSWSEQYNNLKKFRSQHPNQWPSQQTKYPKGNKLGIWYAVQIQAFRRDKLLPERLFLLKEMNFVFKKKF